MFGKKINTNKNIQKEEEERYSPFGKEAIKSSTIKTMAKDKLLLEKNTIQIFSDKEENSRKSFSEKNITDQKNSPFFEGNEKLNAPVSQEKTVSFGNGYQDEPKKESLLKEDSKKIVKTEVKTEEKTEEKIGGSITFDKESFSEAKSSSEKNVFPVSFQEPSLSKDIFAQKNIERKSFVKETFFENPYQDISKREKEGFLSGKDDVSLKSQKSLPETSFLGNRENVVLATNQLETKEGSITIHSSFFSFRKIAMTFLGILVFIFLLGGGYYLEQQYHWISWMEKKEEDDPLILIPPDPITLPEEKPVAESKYLLNEINVISLQEEDSISLKIEEIREELDMHQQENQMFTFSFVLEDASPLLFSEAFPAFAASTKSIFSVSSWLLLATLDGGSTKFGLVGNLSSDVKAKETFQTNEKRTKEFFSLLYPEKINLSNNPVSFSDSIYRGKNIRYWNVDSENTYSFDYTLFEKKFLIGTSKNSMRIFLDTIVDIENFMEEVFLIENNTL